MAACRIVYEPVSQAIQTIDSSADKYQTAGDSFVTAFNTAIAEMEGASKDALAAFFKNNVQPFVTDSLPGAVKGMKSLLESNLNNFTDVDQKIADSINAG